MLVVLHALWEADIYGNQVHSRCTADVAVPKQGHLSLPIGPASKAESEGSSSTVSMAGLLCSFALLLALLTSLGIFIWVGGPELECEDREPELCVQWQVSSSMQRPTWFWQAE